MTTIYQIDYPEQPDTPVSELPFSACVRVGNLVFVSGQASVDPRGNYISDTFEGEMRRAMANLRKVLGAAGCGFEHVVQTRNYIGKGENFPTFNSVYSDYFRKPYPARTTITDCLGDQFEFEIECIAVVPLQTGLVGD